MILSWLSDLPARLLAGDTMVVSWLAHAGLSVLWTGLFWSAVALVQRRLPSLVETVLCTLPPVAWYWSRESTQYERYRHYRAGYVERLLPWNWSEDQLGDLFVPVGVLAVLVLAHAVLLAARAAGARSRARLLQAEPARPRAQPGDAVIENGSAGAARAPSRASPGARAGRAPAAP